MMAAFLNSSERRAALRVGASVLRDNYPATKAGVTVQFGPNSVEAYAVWLWPGVVRVALRYSGELVAQSLPGQPFKLDAAAQ